MTSLIKRKGNGNGFPALRTNLSDLFDIENFFNEPFLPKSLLAEKTLFSKLPAANIRETDKEYIIELAAPGLKKKDFLVDVDNGCLEIKVEKEEEVEEKDEQFTRKEYSYNTFYRSFDLPETVNAERIKARYEDGVLKVQLPKITETKRKPIKEITVG